MTGSGQRTSIYLTRDVWELAKLFEINLSRACAQGILAEVDRLTREAVASGLGCSPAAGQKRDKLPNPLP